MRKILFLAATALLVSAAEAKPVYGPSAPKPATPFEYPDRFSLHPTETVEQAQARVNALRKCTKKWALIGAIGGSAFDIATTQINQSRGYSEINPIYGRHASAEEQLAVNGVLGVLTYIRLTSVARHRPEAACKAAKIYAGAKFVPGIANIGLTIRF